jgi:enoyl-[acyl-carrier protein] reductase II
VKKTRLCELLGIEYPVIQAPMDWITDAHLAAAVSNAGGLGVIGPNAGETEVTESVEETGERLRRQIRKAKTLTHKPFGVNLIYMEVPVGFPEGGNAFSDQCLKVTIEEGVAAAVLVGNAPETYTARLKEAGIKVLYRPLPMVNAAAAKRAESVGVDAFIAVGLEGGGHTGSDTMGTSVLVPLIADTLHIPVVAGGGFADGRGLAAALCWGAEGIYMGTRFIAAEECPAHANLKRAIVEAGGDSTMTIHGAIGIVRSLKTPLVEKCAELERNGGSQKDITDLYHSGYLKGMLEGNGTEGTFICGSGCCLINEVKPACEIIENVMAETEKILAGL